MFGFLSRKSFPISANAAIGALASRTSRGALFPRLHCTPPLSGPGYRIGLPKIGRTVAHRSAGTCERALAVDSSTLIAPIPGQRLSRFGS